MSSSGHAGTHLGSRASALLGHLFNNTEPIQVISEISRSGEESDDVTMKEAPETEAQLKSAPAALWERFQMAHGPGAEMLVGQSWS